MDSIHFWSISITVTQPSVHFSSSHLIIQSSNLFSLHSSGLSISSVLEWEEEEEKRGTSLYSSGPALVMPPFGADASLLAFSASVGQHAKVDLLLGPTGMVTPLSSALILESHVFQPLSIGSEGETKGLLLSLAVAPNRRVMTIQ